MVHSHSHSHSDSPSDSDFHPVWRRLWLTAGLLCSAMACTAQPTQPAARASQPDPLDAKARVPALAYVSSLQPDTRQTDRPPLTWREANDSVARIGGWRVYAREAQLPDAAPAPATPPTTPLTPPTQPPTQPPSKSTDPASMPKPIPMPAGHGGHQTP